MSDIDILPEEKKDSISFKIEVDSISVSQLQMCERVGLAMAGKAPYANLDNVYRVLDFYKWGLAFDEFHQKVFKSNGKEWEDADTLDFTLSLQRIFGCHRITPGVVDGGISAWAYKNRTNEPRDWMDTLSWDRVSRIDNFFQEYVGAENNEYMRAVSRNFWMSLVARIYRPGIKCDNMVILEGRQGIKKSTLFKTVGQNWYSSVQGNLDNKDFYLSMQGKIIFEFAELQNFDRTDIKIIKNMISTPTDRFRVPFARRTQDFPRQLIFAGTTNEHVYLLDDTGGRRYWPIECNNEIIDTKKLKLNRDQLFAEAVEIFKNEEVEDDEERLDSSWWIVPSSASEEQEARRQQDPWEDLISDYVAGRQDVETVDILLNCFKYEKSKLTRFENMRVGKILRVLGFERTRKRVGSELRWFYSRPTPTLPEEVIDDQDW